ncbi:hydantoinase/oxoprolinase family protein [Brucella cytisi]|uniref:hydantoinase/oxoprolinase family protein n=1 Tax=Brucella cytisi TaxID=407152 RepID=UPI0035DA2A2D
MRLACDTGGTFTDLMVEGDDGTLRMFKSSTIPSDPAQGILNVLALAATDFGQTLSEFLASCGTFIHGTTHSINAIITGHTAKTAFLTSLGHPEILVLREGGRSSAFPDHATYPEPYIPRALTFEVPGRLLSDGSQHVPLDEAAVIEIIGKLKEKNVEAVGVCLLWSIVNPAHEIRIGKLLSEHLPHVAVTLSHQLNPSMREFRRASSTCMDASLKPLMGKYLGRLETRLRESGFNGRLLVLTSQAGMIDSHALAQTPIHSLNSGPSTAPVGGRHFSILDTDNSTAIISDTGGTTYDVSLVRHGAIPTTRDMWIGEPYVGHNTGFPSVDVRSIGAGGGSIAHIDEGGMLHVGPKSAGAMPGPACFGNGNTEPTFTDACVVLGYIDPDYFLGGKMKIDGALSREAVESAVARPLGLSVEEAAAAIVDIATENMVQAIEEITVNQGIDPAEATLIGGGGAAGLNSVFIAKRLNCLNLLYPETSATLSAAGALMSDLAADHQLTGYTVSDRFDREKVNGIIASLKAKCDAFAAGAGKGALQTTIEYFVEARYEKQVWEVELPLPVSSFKSNAELDMLIQSFHDKHREIFTYHDNSSHVEFITWIARVRCRFRDGALGRLSGGAAVERPIHRPCYFSGHGTVDTAIMSAANVRAGEEYRGPAIFETPFTTIVVDPTSSFSLTDAGSVLVKAGAIGSGMENA